MATQKKNQKAAPKVSLVNKITVKDVCGGKVPRITEETPLMRVIGFAQGLKTGESTFGEWVALLGQFKATNLMTGEIYSSAKCILPDIAQEGIVAALQSGAAKTVEFALDIIAIPAETPTGYQYVAQPLLDNNSDALEALEARILLALPSA
jgi:hypothetical protein